METIRRFIDFSGPVVYVVMFVLATWILDQAGCSSLNLSSKQLSHRRRRAARSSRPPRWWSPTSAALLLNFGDFSRFAPAEARSSGAPSRPAGQLPRLRARHVVVTAGSVEVFGEAIRDPVEIVARIDNMFVVILGAVTFIIADHRHQHRRQLRLAGLRPRQRRAEVHRLQARRPDHSCSPSSSCPGTSTTSAGPSTTSWAASAPCSARSTGS